MGVGGGSGHPRRSPDSLSGADNSRHDDDDGDVEFSPSLSQPTASLKWPDGSRRPEATAKNGKESPDVDGESTALHVKQRGPDISFRPRFDIYFQRKRLTTRRRLQRPTVTVVI